MPPRAPRRGMPITHSQEPGPPPSRGPRPPRVSQTPLSMHVSTPSRGSGTAACPAAAGVHKILTRGAHGTPHLESCTPYSDDHSAYRGCQDDRHAQRHAL